MRRRGHVFTISPPLALGVHRVVTGRPVMLGGMADFLAVIGIVVFVAAMLGLIWGLERI